VALSIGFAHEKHIPGRNEAYEIGARTRTPCRALALSSHSVTKVPGPAFFKRVPRTGEGASHERPHARASQRGPRLPPASRIDGDHLLGLWLSENVPFLVKDVVLLAVSIYLLKQDVLRVSLAARPAEDTKLAAGVVTGASAATTNP
jgi:hypothetical protein